jgi:hypothetical protein
MKSIPDASTLFAVVLEEIIIIIRGLVLVQMACELKLDHFELN